MKKEIRRNGVAVFRAAFPQALSLWCVNVPRVGVVEAFSLGKTIVLVQDYATGDGWNIFTPTTEDGRIDTTIAAVALRCGVVAQSEGGAS